MLVSRYMPVFRLRKAYPSELLYGISGILCYRVHHFLVPFRPLVSFCFHGVSSKGEHISTAAHIAVFRFFNQGAAVRCPSFGDDTKMKIKRNQRSKWNEKMANRLMSRR